MAITGGPVSLFRRGRSGETSDHQKKKERPLDIKKFETRCSFRWDNSSRSCRHAGNGIRIKAKAEDEGLAGGPA